MLTIVLGYVGYLRYKEGIETFQQYITATTALFILDLITIYITVQLAVR